MLSFFRTATAPSASPDLPPNAVTFPKLRRRFLSMVYESLLLFAVVFISGFLFDTLSQSRSALKLRHAREVWLFFMMGVYFVWFWTHGGQTLAMKTWRIRIVEADGKNLRWPRAVLRYLLIWMFVFPALALVGWIGFRGNEIPGSIILTLALVLPPFWMKFDRDQQFIHDRILGTRLVVA